MNISKSCLSILFLIFSHSVWSDTFNLICDIKIEPLTQATYRFDTDAKTVSQIGTYTGVIYSEQTPYLYKTIGWNLEQDMLIWVSNNFETSSTEQSDHVNRTFDIIIFDFKTMYITLSSMSRKGGLVEHALEFTERCTRVK